MAAALEPERIMRIRQALSNIGSTEIISYAVPWFAENVIERDSIDMLISMSVMEHIDDLDATYDAAWNWLKHGGVMSHEIDFRCHGHATLWNGHWSCLDLTWKMVRGNRPYLINREPHSKHRDLLRKFGFEPLIDKGTLSKGGISRDMLVRRFRQLSDVDLETSNAYMLSRRIAT